MVEILRIKLGKGNCYLVQTDEVKILVDTSNPGWKNRVEKRLNNAGISPNHIDLVILTHGHPDHSGNAAQFRRDYGMDVAMHPDDARRGKELLSRGVKGRMLKNLSNTSVKDALPIKPDIELADGMSLAAYGLDATVIHLPGHTAGSVGILFDDGRLIAGDMYMNFDKPSLALIAEDFAQLDQSHAKLCEYDSITTVYPGHGDRFEFSEVR